MKEGISSTPESRITTKRLCSFRCCIRHKNPVVTLLFLSMQTAVAQNRTVNHLFRRERFGLESQVEFRTVVHHAVNKLLHGVRDIGRQLFAINQLVVDRRRSVEDFLTRVREHRIERSGRIHGLSITSRCIPSHVIENFLKLTNERTRHVFSTQGQFLTCNCISLKCRILGHNFQGHHFLTGFNQRGTRPDNTDKKRRIINDAQALFDLSFFQTPLRSKSQNQSTGCTSVFRLLQISLEILPIAEFTAKPTHGTRLSVMATCNHRRKLQSTAKNTNIDFVNLCQCIVDRFFKIEITTFKQGISIQIFAINNDLFFGQSSQSGNNSLSIKRPQCSAQHLNTGLEPCTSFEQIQHGNGLNDPRKIRYVKAFCTFDTVACNCPTVALRGSRSNCMLKVRLQIVPQRIGRIQRGFRFDRRSLEESVKTKRFLRGQEVEDGSSVLQETLSGNGTKKASRHRVKRIDTGQRRFKRLTIDTSGLTKFVNNIGNSIGKIGSNKTFAFANTLVEQTQHFICCRE